MPSSDLDNPGRLRSLVSLMVDKHGIRAPAVAQVEALKARRDGDLRRAREWGDVARLAEAELNSGLE